MVLPAARRSGEAILAAPSRATGKRMFGVLGLGFLLGMQHALEADHIAAVSSRAVRRRDSVHCHRHGFRWRSLLGGLMLGMAGSAALIVLAVWPVANPAAALLYVVLFGAGSTLGMGALSLVIAVPIAASARWLSWVNRGLQGAVGAITIGIGVVTIYSMVDL